MRYPIVRIEAIRIPAYGQFASVPPENLMIAHHIITKIHIPALMILTVLSDIIETPYCLFLLSSMTATEALAPILSAPAAIIAITVS